MDAATRRNLEITQNLAGGTDNTLASALDCTVTPMGSRMLKRWLHMPVRDTAVLVERQQTIGALQERYTELQPALRQVGDSGAYSGASGAAYRPAARSCPHASCPAATASAA